MEIQFIVRSSTSQKKQRKTPQNKKQHTKPNKNQKSTTSGLYSGNIFSDGENNFAQQSTLDKQLFEILLKEEKKNTQQNSNNRKQCYVLNSIGITQDTDEA